MKSRKFQPGDLVRFEYSSQLLSFGIHKDLVGQIGIIIKFGNELDGVESFYLVCFHDRIVSVAEHQIVAATISHYT